MKENSNGSAELVGWRSWSLALGQRVRNYLEQLLTEASTHVLTADFKKTKKKNREKREKSKHHGNAESDKQFDKEFITFLLRITTLILSWHFSFASLGNNCLSQYGFSKLSS